MPEQLADMMMIASVIDLSPGVRAFNANHELSTGSVDNAVSKHLNHAFLFTHAKLFRKRAPELG